MYEVITAIMDVALVVCLGFCAFNAWMMYHKMPVRQSKFLFWGFVTLALLDIGFVAIDFWFLTLCWPTAESTRDFAEAVVALRLLPAAFLAMGMYYLRRSIERLF